MKEKDFNFIKYLIKRARWTIIAFLIAFLFIFLIHKIVDFPYLRMVITMGGDQSHTEAVTLVFECMMGTMKVEEYNDAFSFFNENDVWVTELHGKESLEKSLVRRETKLLMPWQRKHIRMYIDKLLEQGENKERWYNVTCVNNDVAAEVAAGQRFWSSYVLKENYNPPAEGEVFEFPHDRAMENQYLLQLSYYLEEIAPFQTKLPPGD